MKGSVYALSLMQFNVALLEKDEYSKMYQKDTSKYLPHVIQLHVTNDSDIPIRLSLDGINDHDIVLPNRSFSIDIPVENKGFIKGFFIRSDKSGSDKSGSDHSGNGTSGNGMFYIATYCISTGV